MPDDIANSIPIIKKICAAFTIPILVKNGFEADDIIGTLAHQAEKASNLTPDPLRVQPSMTFKPLTQKSERALGQARLSYDVDINCWIGRAKA